MPEKKKLAGLVAAILNERELVINIGNEAGVAVGMRFKVLDQEKAVKDPITNEELGTVRREKIRVKVVDVQPKMSVARTYETYQVNIGGGMPSTDDLLRVFRPPEYITHVRTLRYKDAGIDYTPLDDKSSFVKVGDPVETLEDE